MRRRIILSLIIICIFCTVGCSKGNNIEVPTNFYYCTTSIVYNDPNGVISPEVREAKSPGEDLTGTLNLYLQGPKSSNYYNPFPENTVVEAIMWDNSTLIITVSAQYNQLSGLDLTLASSCLAKTVMELTGQQAVKIQCAEGLLDGNPSITLTKDSLLLVDITNSTTETTE